MGSDDLLDSDELRGRIWRGKGARSARVALPTGFAALDRYLPGGGWPLGPLIEVFVERYGVGELSLLMPALAALTGGRGSRAPTRKWVAWIAPPFVPYAPALQQRGHRRRRVVARAPEQQRVSVDGRASHSLGLELRRVGLACGGRSHRLAAFAAGGRGAELLDDSIQRRPLPGTSGRPRFCASVSSRRAWSRECGSTNAAAHGPGVVEIGESLRALAASS